MRELSSHKVNPANDILKIEVLDSPGSGGANHCYSISGFDYARNKSAPSLPSFSNFADEDTTIILFQNGPINEVGVNGLTHEALLAILIDRLEGFQAGPYASPDNEEALYAMRAAQTALQRRTRERMARGVEGTHTI